MHTSDVLIVGAGICGLMAAQALQMQGKTVIVVDRAMRVGGRMVTEHIGQGWGDTGAQFFSAREAAFQAFVDEWLAAGVLFVWATGWADEAAVAAAPDGYTRYAAYEGLTAVPRTLAQNLNIHKAVEIVSVHVENEGWTAVAASNDSYHSQALILTPPAPQALALVKDVPLAAADRAALERIQYAPCLCGLALIEGETTLPAPGALQRPEYRISWLADNRRKGISPQATTVTLHASPAASRLWWLSPEAELIGAFKRELRPFLTPDAAIEEIRIRRWPYALPITLHPERTLRAANLPPLAFAGDAFNGPRVEGAALSGLAAAAAVNGNPPPGPA